MRMMIGLALALGVLGCSEIEDDSVLDNDSLVVIPIGPGTDPRTITPPDTPQSRSEGRESSATPPDTFPRRQ